MSKQFKKILAMIVTLAISIASIAVPVSAAYNYGNQAPYVRSWLDAINDYEVIDYYQYSSSDNGYTKTATINYDGYNAYYKTVDAVLTTSLSNESIGFDAYGNIWFIDTSWTLLYCSKGSKSVSSTGTSATDLSFDDNNFVIGYYYNGYSYPLSSSNGNGGNNWNDIWGNNNGNGGDNWNDIWGNNSNVKYPYITIEDNKLTYCESSDKHHSLYLQDGYLVMNNIILHKNGVKQYGFTKNGVAYITNSNRIVTYEFGAKKQYVQAKKVSDLVYDDNDTGLFIIGYKKGGKTYYL